MFSQLERWHVVRDVFTHTPDGLLYRDQYVCWQEKASYKLFDYDHRVTEVLGVTDIMAAERLV